MQELALEIKKLWPTITQGFQEHVQKNWKTLYLTDFSEWRKEIRTEEITKVVSPIFNQYLKLKLKSIGFVLSETNGKDYVWNNIELEGKLSLSTDDKWTGNGFTKTSWHMLVKMNLDSYGSISGSFVCLIPLNECESSWTNSGPKSNFSSLELRITDIGKIIPVWGFFEKKTLYLRPILV